MIHHQTVVGETDAAAWAYVEARMAFNPAMNRQGDSRTLRQMYEDGLRKRTDLLTPVHGASALRWAILFARIAIRRREAGEVGA